MRKYAVYIAPFLLMAIPVAELLAALFGYQWVFDQYRGFAVVYTAVFCASVMLLPHDELSAPVAALAVPMSVVNLYIQLFKAEDWFVILLFLLCALLSVRLLKAARAGKVWKTLSAVIAALLLALYLVVLPFTAFAIAVGETTVVDAVHSPYGTYRAELLNVDQGALGGDTAVKVYDETRVLNLGFCRLEKRPQTVYIGPWGEFEDMELYWESDTVLRINGKAYEIED